MKNKFCIWNLDQKETTLTSILCQRYHAFCLPIGFHLVAPTKSFFSCLIWTYWFNLALFCLGWPCFSLIYLGNWDCWKSLAWFSIRCLLSHDYPSLEASITQKTPIEIGNYYMSDGPCLEPKALRDSVYAGSHFYFIPSRVNYNYHGPRPGKGP